LPVSQCKNEILAEVRKNPTVICISETGSGKSTQVPQFLFEAELHHKKMIAVTQPRRVAAITLAQRVAEEMERELGTLVGYKVRFDSCVSEHTKIAVSFK
jgi:ATP-dependent RNA helicase DHX33